MSPQNKDVLNYIIANGRITTWTATVHLGVCRLSERIRELEAMGYLFSHTRIGRNMEYAFDREKTFESE